MKSLNHASLSFIKRPVNILTALLLLSACGSGSSTNGIPVIGTPVVSTPVVSTPVVSIPVGGTSNTVELSNTVSFTAWVGTDDSNIVFTPALNNGIELYSSRDANCDINSFATCTNGEQAIVNGSTANTQALNLTNAAYLQLRDGATTSAIQAVSSFRFSSRNEHQAVAFKNRLWVVGGLSGNSSADQSNDVWSSTEGANWVQVTTTGTTFSARRDHQTLVFDDKIWVIGGLEGNTVRNDVWSSEDGITWLEVNSTADFSARSAHQALVYKDALWVIGGEEAANTRTNDVWRSDDGIDWSQVTTAGTIFTARESHQALVHNDALWVIGGSDSIGRTNDVWRSNDDGATWTLVPLVSGNTFTARESHQALEYDNALWVIGGNGGSDTSDVWRSADEGGTWTQVTDSAVFSARQSHQALVYNNALWVIGGLNGATRMNDTWSSTDGIAWEEASVGIAFSARDEHQVLEFNNRLWLIGGFDVSDDVDRNDVWSSTDGINWREVTPSGTIFSVRSGHQTLVYENKLWVIGGINNTGRTNDVWSSVDGVNWIEVTSSANFSARDSHQALVHDNALWVIGGRAIDGGIKNDVWRSDNDGVTWTEVLPSGGTIFSAREKHQALVHNGGIWVIGGLSNIEENDVWFSTDGINWNEVTANAAFPDRFDHQVLSYDSRLWVIAGEGAIDTLDDVWSSADGGVNWTEFTNPDLPALRGHQALIYNNTFLVIEESTEGRKNEVRSSTTGEKWRLGYRGTVLSTNL